MVFPKVENTTFGGVQKENHFHNSFQDKDSTGDALGFVPWRV
jgi:hypothetical protein